MARCALAYGLVVTLAAMLGMAAAVETVKPEWRDPEFGHRLRRLQQAEARSPGRPLVLALGTSRTQYAISPAAMGFADEPGSPLVFNFGQSGATALGLLLTLARLCDAGVRPAAVVVEILPAWLAMDGPAEEQFAEKAARLTATDLRHLAPYCDDPGVLRDRWLAARAAPWHAQRLVLMSHWLPRWVAWPSRVDFQWTLMDPDGFTPFPHADPTPELRARMTAHARREYADAFPAFYPGEASLRALRDLVGTCRANGIRVAFYLPPVSPGFRGWFEPRAWADAHACLGDLARELAVPLFPAPPEFPEPEFIDGHHMMAPAAAVYSRWLADTHLRPWLAHPEIHP